MLVSKRQALSIHPQCGIRSEWPGRCWGTVPPLLEILSATGVGSFSLQDIQRWKKHDIFSDVAELLTTHKETKLRDGVVNKRSLASVLAILVGFLPHILHLQMSFVTRPLPPSCSGLEGTHTHSSHSNGSLSRGRDWARSIGPITCRSGGQHLCSAIYPTRAGNFRQRAFSGVRQVQKLQKVHPIQTALPRGCRGVWVRGARVGALW